MSDIRYNRFDNQSPAESQIKADDVSVGRTAFDWSWIQNGNAMIGQLFPLKPIWCVPNEDISLSLSSNFEFRNPTTRQLYNGFRIFFSAYWQPITDLWEGARNWIDNGRTGKVELQRPALLYKCSFSFQRPALGDTITISANANTPMSLLNFFGFSAEAMNGTLNPGSASPKEFPPLRAFQTAVSFTGAESASSLNWPDLNMETFDNSPDFVPADLCFMYQKIWRDYYCNKNLLQTNSYWFPNNEEHFILSYSCTEAVCIKYEDELLERNYAVSPVTNHLANILGCPYTGTDSNILHTWIASLFDGSFTPEPNSPSSVVLNSSSSGASSSRCPNLAGIKFRQFRGDRFTTASPFPDLIRGDVPVLAATQDALQNVGANLYVQPNMTDSVGYADNVLLHTREGFDSSNLSTNFTKLGVFASNVNVTHAKLAVKLGSLGVTQSDLYTLETLTAFRRRMGMTNGDFNETVKAQFGVSPHVHDRKAQLIGSFYQDFVMNKVVQTSESSSSSPLGTTAGNGSSVGSGSLGHVHTDNFGWIMILCSIVPDVYYTQGVDRQFSIKSNMELYFPIFNNLPAQAILNKELYVSGNTSSDDDVFGYEDRYAEYKSSRNVICGFMGLPVAKAEFDTARIIARRFTSTPQLNSLFVTMIPENVDMSPFTVDNEPPFDFSISVGCRRVFPGPYAAIEGSLSSPNLVRG